MRATNTTVPNDNSHLQLPASARHFSVYPIWFCAYAKIKGELRGANKAEAIVVVAVVRVVVVTVSNLAVVRVVVPRTATLATVRARRGGTTIFPPCS